MARGSQFIRQWKLLSILSARRFGSTLEDLAEELGYHARTVRRDIEVLASVGFPLARKRDPTTRQVKIGLPEPYRAPNIPFTLAEVLSFYFSSNLLRNLRGTPMKEGIDTALLKIEKILPVHFLDYASRAENALLVKNGPLKDYKGHVETLSRLHDAIADRKKVVVRYRAYGQDQTDRHVYHPYGVTFADGSLYIIGHSELRQARRIFLLERIHGISVTVERFEHPPDFDLDEYLAEGFGISHEDRVYDVRIEFEKYEAQFIREREWHPTQKLADLPKGRVLLTMKVTGLADVLRWVLSFGAGARALSPPELVKGVSENVRGAARTYKHQT